jgi:hypothetical protein
LIRVTIINRKDTFSVLRSSEIRSFDSCLAKWGFFARKRKMGLWLLFACLVCVHAQDEWEVIDNGMCVVQNGVDYMFNDLTSLSLSSIDECCDVSDLTSVTHFQACWDNFECLVFTWLKPSAGQINGTCWLKFDEAEEATENPEAVTGWPCTNLVFVFSHSQMPLGLRMKSPTSLLLIFIL